MTAPTNAISGSVMLFFRPWSKFRFFAPFEDADGHVSAEPSFEQALGGVARYTVHIFVGTILCILIAGVSLFLRYISYILTVKLGAPKALELTISLLGSGIYTVDMLLFLIFILRSTVKSMTQLWRE